MLRRATTSAGSVLSQIFHKNFAPSNHLLAVTISNPPSADNNDVPLFTSNQPQRRWNKRFRARELDELWETYYARKKAEVIRDRSGNVVPSLKTGDDDDDDDLSTGPPNNELVAWGDFELQPFVDLVEFPDVLYDINPNKLSKPDNSDQTSFTHISRVLGDILNSNGVTKSEAKEWRTGNRHIKRTTAKRALKRTRKFNADQRAIRRILWLIDRRRDYERHFDELEDSVDDPYAGTEFWMNWQNDQTKESMVIRDSPITEVRR